MIYNVDRYLLTIAAAECQRQETDPMGVVRLLDAWNFAAERVARNGNLPDVSDVINIGGYIEPRNLARTYRKTPVTFRNGGTAVHHQSVPNALARLVEALPRLGNPANATEATKWIKAFLEIHPFEDGNGRTAWVLYNWLTCSWAAAQPLPEFDWMPV